MSASHRFIFSTFLFLALSCFAVSSAFAAKTYYYYQSWITSGYCSAVPDPICTDAASKYNKPLAECQKSYSSYSDTHYVKAMTRRYVCTQYDPATGNCTGGGYTGDLIQMHTDASGTSLKKVCQDGETFKLDGCTATCEVDPCAPLEGQEFSGVGECGSFTCPNGGKIVSNGLGKVSCDKGTPVLSYQPPQSGVNTQNSCTGTLKNFTHNASVDNSLTGSSGGSFFCSATYTYTGVTGTPENIPDNLATLSAYDAVPMPENGVCPPDRPQSSTINGQQVCIPNTLPDDDNCPVDGEKQNSNGVCVGPNDPTYPQGGEDPNKDPDENTPNTCPKGQIKNNSGVCVPYGDATNCPVGQVRSNLGTCITDPKANTCPVGQIKNSAGACVQNPKGTGCADGSTPNANGVCANGVGACPVGQTRNASGVCVTTSPSSGCKDGSTANASGICSDGSGACPVGKIRNASGVCVSDPDDPDSSKSASLASNCETAPECDGDPIQCAMYHHQWKSNCDAIRAPDENEKAQIRGAIEDTNNQIDGRENEYKDSINAIIADSGLLNNPVPTTAQCIPDKTINIMSGVSITVPYSLLCPYFSLLRSMLIMVAYLFAARIIYAELTGGGIRV